MTPMILKFLLLTLLTGKIAAHFECGTSEPDLDRAAAFTGVVRQYQAKKNTSGRRALQPSTFAATVPTVYHIVETADTAGNLTDATIHAQHAVLNADFANSATGFSYELIAITRTVNDDWAVPFPGSSAETDMKAALHQGDFDTLNIYVVQLPIFFGGYASLPTVLLLDGPEQDGVVINAAFLPGGAAPSNDLGKILSHEVGHWHDLYHTFQGSCTGEFGDFVADTRKSTPSLRMSESFAIVYRH
jgi:Pregnancy-associated plasma protein-A